MDIEKPKYIDVDVHGGKLITPTHTDEYMRWKRREWVKSPELMALEANDPVYLNYRRGK